MDLKSATKAEQPQSKSFDVKSVRFGSEQSSEQTGRTSSILIHEVKSGQIELAHGENDVLAFRLAKLEKHVSNNREFSRWLSKVDDKRAEKLSTCGCWLLFRDYFSHPDRPRKLAGGIFCQQPLLCGACAAARSARHVQALRDRLSHRLSDHGHLVPYMVTLTAKSQPELPAMISHVWRAWSTLMQRRRDSRKGRSDSITGTWDGGFVASEAKRGAGGHGWHFHLHGIVLGPAGRYVPMWERLKREWAGVLGQKQSSVQFQPLREDYRARLESRSTIGYMNSILEVVKYAVKWEPGQNAERWEAAQALRRVRTLRTFGSFYGMKLPEEVTDDLSGLENFEYRELVYRILNGKYGAPESIEAQRETAFDDWNENR